MLLTPTWITAINGDPLDLALLGCVGSRLEGNNPSDFLRRRRNRYAASLMPSSKHLAPFEVCGGSDVAHQFKVSFYDETEINWALATMASTLGTNILCTTLIVGRIIYVARGHRGIMGGIRTYRGVIEILVESAALYSIIYVVLMILYPLKGNGLMYPQTLSYPVTVRPVTSICIVLCLTST